MIFSASNTDLSLSAGFLFFLSIQISEYLRLSKKPKVIFGSKESAKLVESCPTLNKIFYPSPLIWGAHTSLIPFILKGIWQKSIFPTVDWKSEVCILPGKIL